MLKFTEDHEWLRTDDGITSVGITQHATEQLGDLVFVDLPEVGAKLSKGDTAATIESVKAASEIAAPLDGEVVEVNESLRDDPAIVNGDPLGAGWFFKLKLNDPSALEGLMDESAYQDMIA